ncbi:hypothetical protein SDC9_70167 [bioreactor metagenome]|uniref:Uncharacterized protein n=1 Tax=bioreactor metagenome TaxID=1076179 RepID=A0A644YAW4_9ZZZZ
MQFSDLGNLVLRMDEIMDARNYPQAYQRSRTFLTRKKKAGELMAENEETGIPAREVEAARGKLGAFSVAVFSRRSSCWQGMVDWLDGAPREEFESILIFLRKVDERFAGK